MKGLVPSTLQLEDNAALKKNGGSDLHVGGGAGEEEQRKDRVPRETFSEREVSAASQGVGRGVGLDVAAPLSSHLTPISTFQPTPHPTPCSFPALRLLLGAPVFLSILVEAPPR